MLSTFKRLFLPGLVFQSISVAGGYGTGRELAEFFLQYGPVGGQRWLVPVGSAVRVAEFVTGTRDPVCNRPY